MSSGAPCPSSSSRSGPTTSGPWCYIGLGEVDRLKQSWDFAIDWRPFLLRPETPDEGLPLPDRVKAYMAMPDNPLVTRAKAMGLAMRFDRTLIPSTRRAHQAALWARSQGGFERFHHELLRRYWEAGEDLHAWEVLQAAATTAGLDASALRAEVEAGRWKQPLEDALAEASGAEVHAVPTFLVGNRFVIQGAQDHQVFAHAFQRLGFHPRA